MHGPTMLTDEIQKDIATVSRLGPVTSILKLVAELTGMRVTMVARVTPDSWTACAAYDQMGFGLQVGTQLDVATTLCKEVCDHRETIVIRHASVDPVYQHHRTPKMYKIESYIAIPILAADGSVFGTLCAIDSAPAELSPQIVAALRHFTELIAAQLALEAGRAELNNSLLAERRISQLREQFIAILGHDLRNPLSGIAGSVELLKEVGAAAVTPELIDGLDESVGQMTHLIADTMDFARSRMGSGIVLERAGVVDVAALVQATVDELAQGRRTRRIEFARPAPLTAKVDAVRIRQVFSNLVGNALQHSPADSTISVRLEEAGGAVRFAVTNHGVPLSNEMLRGLFEPFQRSSAPQRREGLGLGLYIASEIVKAHGGSIHAESDAKATTFTVLLPAAK